MGTFILYIVKSGFCLVLFCLFYKLMMRRTTLFRFNRITILSGICLCLVLPFVQLRIQKETPLQAELRTLQEFLVGEEVATEQAYNQVSITALPADSDTTHIPVADNRLFWKYILVSIYLLGCIFTALHFILSTIRMNRLIHRSPHIIKEGYTLVLCNDAIAPFNWGHYIVLSKGDYANYPQEIILHELMHLRYHHTRDLLIAQFLIILHWFNPACWLLKRDLQEVHEYEADNGVVNTGIDATRYQLLLVKKAVGTRLYSMVSGFNHSKLKNRITMMLKEKTTKYAQLRLLLLVPVLAGVLYLFAQPQIMEMMETPTQEKLVGNPLEKELKEYETLIHGRPLTESERTYKGIPLYVNKKDRLLVNNEHVTLSNLKEFIKTLVKDERSRSLAKTGKAETVIFTFICDRGTSNGCVEEIKNIISNLSKEMKESLLQTEADFTDPNKLYPLLLHEETSKNFAQISTKEGVVVGVKLTIQDAQNNYSRVLDNFTIEELKTEINELYKKPNASLTICCKIDPGTPAGVVMDIKQVLKESCKSNSSCPVSL